MSIMPQPMMNIAFTDGTTLRVSKTHKFLMVDGSWKQVFELFESGQGSVIKGLEIDKTIQTIEHVGAGPAVKLTVEDAHTYISDGLVSHNIKVVDNVSNSTLEA
jgi:intein/homing endonuclease